MKIKDLFERTKYIDKAEKIVVNFSGGLDSTILLYALLSRFSIDNIVLLSFDYNQRHKDIELYQAQKTINKLGVKHKILKVPFIEHISKYCSSMVMGELKVPKYEDIYSNFSNLTTYVPFRNFIFSSISLSYAESIGFNSIALGIQYGDYENKKYEYWDCSENFYNKLQELVSLNTKNEIFILAPFVKMKKEDELEIALELNVPLENTWTCYDPQITTFDEYKLYKPCLKCPSCVSRKNAFYNKNLIDPLLNGIYIKTKKKLYI